MQENSPQKTFADDNSNRWYIMTYPEGQKRPPTNLSKVKNMRELEGDSDFDYLQPTYKETTLVRGKWVYTQQPLLLNYVFIHSSVSTIFKLKQFLPTYNFLPSMRSQEGLRQFPYLSDEAMQNLRWVAKSYDNTLPVYTPKRNELMKGDKIRILEGRPFEGASATVVETSGNGRKVMVCIDDFLYVPLLNIEEGDYVVTELCTDDKRQYERFNNRRQLDELHRHLCQMHRTGSASCEATALAQEVLRQCAYLQNIGTDILRSKQYAHLLPAYRLLGDQEKFGEVMSVATSLATTIKAELSAALLYLTLYACTDSSVWHDKAHRLIDPWQKEKNAKKQKQQLVEQLSRIDEAYGH